MFYNFLKNKSEMKPLNILSILKMYDSTPKVLNNKINELPRLYHSNIFDFEYPLSEKINKDEFEIKIIKHFITRRINYETINMFKLALDDKLNTIMPMYNLYFDSIFTNTDLLSEKTVDTTIENNTNSNNSSSVTNSSGNSSNISDNRSSETPQNDISSVQNGEYLSNYDFNTITSTDSTNSSVSTNNSSNGNSTINYNHIKYLNGNEIKDLIQNLNNVYELIYNDLESLFYQIYE